MSRKILAFLLAACLILQPTGSAVYAAQVDPAASQEQMEAETGTVPENADGGQQMQEEPQEPEAEEDVGAQETIQDAPSETVVPTEPSSSVVLEEPTGNSQESQTVTPTESTPALPEASFPEEGESGSQNETVTSTETEPVLEPEIGTESETETENVTETETETETEVETILETQVEPPRYLALDDSVSQYIWQNPEVTTGSGQAVFSFQTKSYPNSLYAVYTADESLDFFPDAVSLTSDQYSALRTEGYQTVSLSCENNWDNSDSLYHSTTVLSGLSPQTSYRMQVVFSKYMDGQYVYYFVTEPISFTTKALSDESALTFSDLTLSDVGYTGASLEVALQNPDLETIKSLAIVDETGKTMSTWSLSNCQGKTEVPLSGTISVPDISKSLTVKICAKVDLADQTDAEVCSQELEIRTLDKADFIPETTVSVAGSTAYFTFSFPDWHSVDNGKIEAVLEYREKNSNSPQTNTTVLYGDRISCSYGALEENTEYVYSIRYETVTNGMYDPVLLYESEEANFFTGKIVTYTQDDFDPVLWTEIQKKLYGKEPTNVNLAAITSLSFTDDSGETVKSLNGLQYLTGLTSLTIRYQSITSAEQVSDLTRLETLYLDYNDLTTMPDLSGLTQLTYLDFGGNLLPEGEVTADKLPAAFLAGHSSWISNTIKAQRGELTMLFPSRFYATGENTWAFLARVSGVKKSGNYSLSVTVGGQDYTGESKYISNTGSGSVLTVKGILGDPSSGTTGEVTYKLIGSNGKEYAQGTQIFPLAADPEKTAETIYASAAAEEIYVSAKLSLTKTQGLGSVKTAELLNQNGEIVASSNSVNVRSYTSDDRYTEELGSSSLDTGYQYSYYSFSLQLARYLAPGSYSVRLTGDVGTVMLENRVEIVGDSCIVKRVAAQYAGSSDSYDNGTCVYVEMDGENIDATKVWPVIEGETGEEILEYEGVASNTGTEAVYRYKRVGEKWNDSGNYTIRGVWHLETAPGYAVIDAASSHSINFYISKNENPILVAHYNYKKEALEVKVSSRLPEESAVKVTLADSSTLSSGQIFASGEGKVQNHWVSVSLQDAQGEPYVPARDAYLCVHLELMGEGGQSWFGWEQIPWYNYSVGDGSAAPGRQIPVISSSYMTTEDENVTVQVYRRGLSANTQASLQVYNGDGEKVLESAVFSLGKETSRSVTLSFHEYPNPAQGEYTVQLVVEGEPRAAGPLYVFKKGVFYIQSQYILMGTSLPENKKTPMIAMDMPQVLKESDTFLRSADDYEVRAFDRLGNPVQGIEIAVVSRYNDSTLVGLILKNVPEDYIGLYFYVRWKGQDPIDWADMSGVYYANGDYENDPELGHWEPFSVDDAVLYANFVANNASPELALHGYYGASVSGDEELIKASAPFYVKVYENRTDTLIKQIKLNIPESGGFVSFSEDDVKGLDPKTIYDMVITDKNGKQLNYDVATGYIVCGQVPVPVSSVKLNKTALTLTRDEGSNTAQLTVSYKPTNANSGTAITWSSADGQVAEVSDSGVVKAVGLGQTVITATSQNGKTASCTVKVVDYSLHPATLELNIGDEEELYVSDGIRNLKAKLSDGLELSCQVTVTNVLREARLNKQEQKLEVGDTDQLAVIFTPADATEGVQVEWQSDNEEAVTVTQDGKVTAVGPGKANVTVTVTVQGPEGPEPFPVKENQCSYNVAAKDNAKIPDGEDQTEKFYVYAVTNVDKTLADVADQLEALPDSWEWVAPETNLAAFAGRLEKDFAVVHKVEHTGRTIQDTVTVRLSTISAVRISGLAGTLPTGVLQQAQLSCEVTGVPLADSPRGQEVQQEMSWSAGTAPRADSIVEPAAKVGDQADTATLALTGKKAGSATVTAQVRLGEGGPVLAEGRQKVTFAASDAVLDVKLIDAAGEVLSSDGNDGDGNEIYRLAVSQYGQIYVKDQTPPQANGKAWKLTIKSSDSAVLKVGKAETLSSGEKAVKLTLQKNGYAVLTVSANDKYKTSKRFGIFVVKNGEDVCLTQSSVTINDAWTDPAVDVQVSDGFAGAGPEEVYFAVGPDNSERAADCPYEADSADWPLLHIRLKDAAQSCALQTKATLYVKYGEEEGGVEKYLPITVKRISKQPAVTVKQTKAVDTFSRSGWGQMSVGAAGETVTGVEVVGGSYDYDFETGKVTLKEAPDGADAIDASQKRCTLQIQVAGYAKPVEKAWTFKTATAGFKLSASSGTVYGTDGLMTVQTQVLSSATKKAVDLKDAAVRVLGADGKEHTGYTAEIQDNTIFLTAKSVPAGTEKLTLAVSKADWNGEAKLAFSVKSAAAAKAALKLGTSSLTLYVYSQSDSGSVSTPLTFKGENTPTKLLKQVKFLGVKAVDRTVLGKGISLSYDETESRLVVKVNDRSALKAGNYKFNVVLPKELSPSGKELKAVLTVKVVEKEPTVKISAKGSIDVLNRKGTNVVLTPTFTNVDKDAVVTKVRLTGRDAHLFEIVDRNQNAVTVRLKEDENVITKYAYEVGAAYTVKAGETQMELLTVAPAKIKLKQGKIKTVSAGESVYDNNAGETVKPLKFTVTNSVGEMLAIDDIVLTNYQGEFEYDAQEGKLYHRPGGQTARGKTYTLKFNLYLSQRGDNEKPVVVSYKVKIVK